jgi:hypothetical protein
VSNEDMTVRDAVWFFEWVYEWETQHRWTPEMLEAALKNAGLGEVEYE